MTKILFIWYMVTGVITTTEKDCDGKQMYSIIFRKENKAVDFAYKNEVENWISTGVFNYENYCDGNSQN